MVTIQYQSEKNFPEITKNAKIKVRYEGFNPNITHILTILPDKP